MMVVVALQAAHPLVQDRLLKYVYSGFLESVLGPALHQVCAVDCCFTLGTVSVVH